MLFSWRVDTKNGKTEKKKKKKKKKKKRITIYQATISPLGQSPHSVETLEPLSLQ